MSFPLYDNLSLDIPETDITKKEKDFIIKQIKKFDITVHERIYALIRCHQLHHSKDISPIPYDGKTSKINNTGSNNINISFDIEKLPVFLRHILKKFCKMETQNSGV